MKHTKLIGIIGLIGLVLFIVGCNGTGNVVTSTCGDDICDATESCVCQDCVGTPKCPDPSKTAGGIIKPAGCGDGKCMAEERVCSATTHETVCFEDCGSNCPAYVPTPTEITCTGKCEKSGTGFIVKGDSAIQIQFENIGEYSTDIVTSHFKCNLEDSTTPLVRDDGAQKLGVTFSDYFNAGEEETRINSRITGNNIVVYNLAFDFGTLEKTADLVCSIYVDSNVIRYRAQVPIELRVY